MYKKLTALVLCLAMVMSTAAFAFADEGQPDEPAEKAEQVIKVAAEKTLVKGKAANLKDV